MKIVLNPKYNHLREFVESVPGHSYREDAVLWDRRNRVETVEIDGQTLVVKRFKPVGFLKGLWYTFFGKSKARSAYENAGYLLENGVETAEPVAYIEQKWGGLFRRGILICKFLSQRTVKDMYTTVPLNDAQRHNLKHALVHFMVDLHRKGIVPCDFNMDNIFYREDPATGGYRFALIDINRMKHGGKIELQPEPRNVSTQELRRIWPLGVRAMSQLGVNVWELPEFVSAYYQATKANPDETAYRILRGNRRRQKRKRLSHIIKL